MKIRYEPALIAAAVQAVLVLLVSLGLVRLDGDQQAAILTAVAAVLALVTGLITRAQVIPTAKLEDGVPVVTTLPVTSSPLPGAGSADPAGHIGDPPTGLTGDRGGF